MTTTLDGQEFRRILGHYPTGVCAITALAPSGPVGMVVGSFTSVSLDPALVAFLPDRKSNTWPKIQAAGHFCVNILAERQLDASARRWPPRRRTSSTRSPTGSPGPGCP